MRMKKGTASLNLRSMMKKNAEISKKIDFFWIGMIRKNN